MPHEALLHILLQAFYSLPAFFKNKSASVKGQKLKTAAGLWSLSLVTAVLEEEDRKQGV